MKREIRRTGMWIDISAPSVPYRMHPLLVAWAPVQLAQWSRLGRASKGEEKRNRQHLT